MTSARRTRGPAGRPAAIRSATPPSAAWFGRPVTLERPASYVPLNAFWSKPGYVKQEGMLGSYEWQDIGDAAETEKPMQFWVKPL